MERNLYITNRQSMDHPACSQFPTHFPRYFASTLRFCYRQRRTRRTLMSVNKAILVGRLGRDPETRYTGGGQAVANFSVATDETYKDKNGERQKRTEWHRIVAWGPKAEFVQKYLKKGNLIYIEGSIRSSEWQDKEGQKRTKVEIIASDFRFIGGKGDGAGAAGGGGGG